jgi:hypothetical protein
MTPGDLARVTDPDVEKRKVIVSTADRAVKP